MAFVIEANGLIQGIGESEDEAWETLSEDVALPEEELKESEDLDLIPATEALVEYVRSRGGEVPWRMKEGTACLDLDRLPTSPQLQRMVTIDDRRYESLRRRADSMGLSISACIRLAVDEWL